MSRWRMFLSFLTVTLSIMAGVHFYIFRRTVLDTALPDRWVTGLAVFFILTCLGIPFSFIAGRVLDRRFAKYLVVPAHVWLGYSFQLFLLLLSIDLVRGLTWVGLRVSGQGAPLFDPVHGLLVWRTVAGSAVAASLLATVFAIWWGLTKLAVRRVDVSLPNLPTELDGFTIAHLSDLHLDLVHGGEWLSSVVEKTNALDPDLVAITGDLAEGSVAQFGEDVEPLRRLTSRHGVFFVTGNHEYFHDLRGWMKRLGALGIRVLRNERAAIERNGTGFDLAGVDDHDGGRIATDHGPNLSRALEGRSPDRPLVLMAHQPRVIREAAESGVGLVLSGHTHGGQIWPFSYLVYLQQPVVRGLHRQDRTTLYVSSGTGFWGPPMRLGTTAEIALITLRSR